MNKTSIIGKSPKITTLEAKYHKLEYSLERAAHALVKFIAKNDLGAPPDYADMAQCEDLMDADAEAMSQLAKMQSSKNLDTIVTISCRYRTQFRALLAAFERQEATILISWEGNRFECSGPEHPPGWHVVVTCAGRI